MSKQKILFIFPRKIFPIIGGDQIRAYQQLEFLSEIFDVNLVYLNSEKEDDNYALKYMPQLKSSKCFVHSKIDCILGFIQTLINLKPIQVNYYKNYQLQSYIRNHQHEFDCLFSGNTRVAEYFIRIPKTKYLDMVDAASMNCKNAIPQSHGLKKIFYYIDSKLMKKYELKMLQIYDKCAIISTVDKKFLENE